MYRPVYASITRLDSEELASIGRPRDIDAFLLVFEQRESESPASPSLSNRGSSPPPRESSTPEIIDLTSSRSSTPDSTPRSPESSKASVSYTPQTNSVCALHDTVECHVVCLMTTTSKMDVNSMDVNSMDSRSGRKLIGIAELTYPELPEGGFGDLTVSRIISIIDPNTLLLLFPPTTPPQKLVSVAADPVITNNSSTESCQAQMLAYLPDPVVTTESCQPQILPPEAVSVITYNSSTESSQPQMLAPVGGPVVSNNFSTESCQTQMLIPLADPSIINNSRNESCQASSSSDDNDASDEDRSDDDHEEESCNLNGRVYQELPAPSVGKCYQTMLRHKEEEDRQEKDRREAEEKAKEEKRMKKKRLAEEKRERKKQRQIEEGQKLLGKEKKKLPKQQNQPAEEQEEKKTRSKKELKQKKSQKVKSNGNSSSAIDYAADNDSGVSLASTGCDPSSHSATPQTLAQSTAEDDQMNDQVHFANYPVNQALIENFDCNANFPSGLEDAELALDELIKETEQGNFSFNLSSSCLNNQTDFSNFLNFNRQ
ncbi:hypothetical protein QAD02_003827 [Eretmocerus hayati]|uniref:Uncharacterized protein n=1 Tax=Eretmocerus hayati TaxID=131215 RepID=A0ACC2NNX8_9HYME|nr:hypothetical protein QAD02_003827 [Eretmocerus hayati]